MGGPHVTGRIFQMTLSPVFNDKSSSLVSLVYFKSMVTVMARVSARALINFTAPIPSALI